MYFIQINGQVWHIFEKLPRAKSVKSQIQHAYTTLNKFGLVNPAKEISLWETGKEPYPYPDARKIS